jgi:thioesterase domain-containing protein
LNYRRLSQYLGAERPFYGLQAQGLDGRLPPLTSVEEMAALYVKEIRGVQPKGPYCLGGGTSGGVVAFEMAQQLQAIGEEVGLLALFDTYSTRPHKDSVTRKIDRLLGNILLWRPKEQATFLFDLAAGKGDRGVACDFR